MPDPDLPRRLGRPRQQPAEGGEVRERLLNAAMDLAVEQGFEACGLREIAARAEVSPAMIAYYFGDRQGLYDAMFRRAFERVSQKVQALIQDPDRTGEDQLADLIRLHVTSMAEDPWIPKMVVRELLLRGSSPSRDHFAKTIGQGPLMLMIRWLEQEQASGVLRSDFDPRLMAITIASLSVFPFLMVPIVGPEIDLELGDEFANRLIEHNQRFLDLGLRAHSEEKS